MTIDRDEYDENGNRYVKCSDCEMSWIESREPVELFPGLCSEAGERAHRCPEPFTLEEAQAWVTFSRVVPVHPRTKAACVLAYKAAGLI